MTAPVSRPRRVPAGLPVAIGILLLCFVLWIGFAYMAQGRLECLDWDEAAVTRHPVLMRDEAIRKFCTRWSKPQ
jgi:hypothetical protein